MSEIKTKTELDKLLNNSTRIGFYSNAVYNPILNIWTIELYKNNITNKIFQILTIDSDETAILVEFE